MKPKQKRMERKPSKSIEKLRKKGGCQSIRSNTEVWCHYVARLKRNMFKAAHPIKETVDVENTIALRKWWLCYVDTLKRILEISVNFEVIETSFILPGVRQDNSRSMKRCREATITEETDNGSNLGTYYRSESGVERTEPKSLRQYSRAAETSGTNSQYILRFVYRMGLEPNGMKSAAQLYRNAKYT